MIKVKKVDVSQVLKKFNDMQDRTKDYRPLLVYLLGGKENMGALSIRGQIKQSFVSQRNADNNIAWKPLNSDYLKAKIEKVGPKPTLIYSGDLYKSLVEGTNNTVQILTQKKLTYGTTLSYLKYHNSIGSHNKIPRRAPLGFNKKIKTYFVKAFKAYISQGMEPVRKLT